MSERRERLRAIRARLAALYESGELARIERPYPPDGEFAGQWDLTCVVLCLLESAQRLESKTPEQKQTRAWQTIAAFVERELLRVDGWLGERR